MNRHCFPTLFILLPALLVAPATAAERHSANVHDRALRSTLRITNMSRNPPTAGSAAVVRRGGNGAWLLTANHVLDPGDAISIEYFADAGGGGTSILGECEVVARSTAADLTLLWLHVNAPLPGEVAICPPQHKTKERQSVFFAGCAGGGPPVGAATTIEQTVEKSTSRFWLASDAPQPGQSGGPLVNDDGLLIGICSAAAADGHGLFGHLQEIHLLCRQAGLEALYQQRPAPRGPAPNPPPGRDKPPSARAKREVRRPKPREQEDDDLRQEIAEILEDILDEALTPGGSIIVPDDSGETNDAGERIVISMDDEGEIIVVGGRGIRIVSGSGRGGIYIGDDDDDDD